MSGRSMPAATISNATLHRTGGGRSQCERDDWGVLPVAAGGRVVPPSTGPVFTRKALMRRLTTFRHLVALTPVTCFGRDGDAAPDACGARRACDGRRRRPAVRPRNGLRRSLSGDQPFALELSADRRKLERVLVHVEPRCQDGSDRVWSGAIPFVAAPPGQVVGDDTILAPDRLSPMGRISASGFGIARYGEQMGGISQTLKGVSPAAAPQALPAQGLPGRSGDRGAGRHVRHGSAPLDRDRGAGADLRRVGRRRRGPRSSSCRRTGCSSHHLRVSWLLRASPTASGSSATTWATFR
jgi:hypothetical protein